jgi:hypothetical protein
LLGSFQGLGVAAGLGHVIALLFLATGCLGLLLVHHAGVGESHQLETVHLGIAEQASIENVYCHRTIILGGSLLHAFDVLHPLAMDEGEELIDRVRFGSGGLLLFHLQDLVSGQDVGLGDVGPGVLGL